MISEIETIVKSAIANQKMISEESIKLESSLEDLGITSLDAITIVYEVEEICHIEVPNDDLVGLETVQDIVTGIQLLLNRKVKA